MTAAQRIAAWLYRDLSTRGGFREVCDQIAPGGQVQLVEFWAARIEEEIGDGRLIKTLEQIRDRVVADPAWAAKVTLGPAREEQARAAGVTIIAYEDRAVQLDLPTPNAQSVTAPPAIDLDDFS